MYIVSKPFDKKNISKCPFDRFGLLEPFDLSYETFRYIQRFDRTF